jgi:3-hydroxyisobutyrate dehydrogenase
MTIVAVIGVGRMGGPIARNIAAAGHNVRVTDTARTCLDALADTAVTVAASPAEAARGAEVVCVVVFDDTQAIEVVDGPSGVLRTLETGAVVCIHTTASVDTVRHLAARGEPRGISVLDAGISGGEDGAQAGTLVTMVGGSPDAVARATPVLSAFSKEVLHAGPLGAGMALKLARNASGYVMMAAVHEAMLLAAGAGVEMAALLHVINETGVLSQALAPFALGGPSPLPADAPEGQRLRMEHLEQLASKDLSQAIALGLRLGAPMPVTEQTRGMFRHVARLD